MEGEAGAVAAPGPAGGAGGGAALLDGPPGQGEAQHGEVTGTLQALYTRYSCAKGLFNIYVPLSLLNITLKLSVWSFII